MSVAVAVLALTWLAGAPSPVTPPRTAIVGPLVKVRPGQSLTPGAAATLSAARGECEAVQVVLLPPAHQISAQVTALEGDGKPIPVRLYRELFLRVTTPSNSEGVTGRWPDPLLPVSDDAYEHQARRALPADSTAEEPLILYVEVCVPHDAKAGPYRGTLALREGGQALPPVALALTVQPFTLPSTSSLPNTFGLSLYSLSKGHHLAPETPPAHRLLRKYAEALLGHRLSAHGLTYEPPPVRWEGDVPELEFDAYDEEVGPFLEGRVLASGARFTTTDARLHRKAVTPGQKAAYLRAFVEHHRKKGWPAQLFFYAKDEPTPKDFPLVVEQSKAARAAGTDLPVLITSPPRAELNASADILCPVLNCFFPRPGPATCSQSAQSLASMRGQLGGRARIWWYQSCMSHGCDGGPAAEPKRELPFRGWASYMVDHPAPRNRAMGPLAFLTGVQGELYFDTVHAYTQGDAWQSVFFFGGNGDGTLFYPGTPERHGGTTHFPVESLRLKIIRDGLEDYEYLTLLAKKAGVAEARRAAERLARSGYAIESDPAVWEAVRAEVTARLAASVPGPAQGSSP